MARATGSTAAGYVAERSGNARPISPNPRPEGAFDEWSLAIVDMVDFVKAFAPRLISFNVFVNEERAEATNGFPITVKTHLYGS